MREMENRGHDLLDKFLNGDITYSEELELFELAAQDQMLKDALEGYIAQEEIAMVSTEQIKEWQSQSPMIVEEKKRKPLFWLTLSRLAAVLVVILISSVVVVLMNRTGEQGKQVVVELDQPTNAVKPENSNEVTIEETTSEVSVKVIDKNEFIAEKVFEKQPVQKEIVVPVEKVIASNSNQVVNTIIEDELETKIHENSITLAEVEEVIEVKGHLSVKEEAFNLEDEAFTVHQEEDAQPTLLSIIEHENEYFDESEDEALAEKVQANSIKNMDRITPITVMDMEINDGVDPDEINNPSKDSVISSNDMAMVEMIGEQVDAASGQKNLKAKDVSVDVVIKEYKIDKRDILNPPMEDYNSLVRVKYKKRGKPSIGFFKYKHYLKENIGVLVDANKSAEHLEEVVIKFRVHKSGDIEFLEVFGMNNEKYIKTISETIVNGPAWELQEYYDSIDIEVPFKVLFPWLF